MSCLLVTACVLVLPCHLFASVLASVWCVACCKKFRMCVLSTCTTSLHGVTMTVTLLIAVGPPPLSRPCLRDPSAQLVLALPCLASVQLVSDCICVPQGYVPEVGLPSVCLLRLCCPYHPYLQAKVSLTKEMAQAALIAESGGAM
jgi:hypothetical protein